MPDARTGADERPEIDPYPLSPYVAWAGRRNRDPILAAFNKLFPVSGHALEIASGSGMHVNYFAPHFPQIRFQPSDMDEDVFGTIRQTRDRQGNGNVADPIRLDLTDPATWPAAGGTLYDVIFVINIFQVAPVSIADGIFEVAARVLKETGLVAIYGPFKVDGKYTTPSNESFDREILAAKVPEWGLKDARDLEKAANRHGLILKEALDLPANNFMLLFAKS